MGYRAFGSIACCLLISLCVLAAPQKSEPLPAYYHPMVVGDKSIFEKSGDQESEFSLEVIDAKQKGANLLVTVQTSNSQSTSVPWCFELSNKGVYRLGEGDVMLKTPECYLRLPIKKGETWETDHLHEDTTITTKYTLAGEEEIEVPAGKFHCIRIETKFAFEGLNYKRTRWEDSRRGLVKQIDEKFDESGTKRNCTTTVLKSFTPGRQ